MPFPNANFSYENLFRGVFPNSGNPSQRSTDLPQVDTKQYQESLHKAKVMINHLCSICADLATKPHQKNSDFWMEEAKRHVGMK